MISAIEANFHPFDVKFSEYHVIDVVPQTQAQVKFLHELLKNDVNIDFWEEPGRIGRKARMMISGDYLKHTLTKQLAYNRLPYTVFNDNVQATVDQERAEIEARRAARGAVFDIDDFNTLADINGWLSEQNANCPAGLTCTFGSIGTSYQGRDINLFTVTASPGSNIIYMDSTTHAREWLTPATNLKIINHLLTGYGSDPEVTTTLDTREWQFVVIENPDGYEYSWTNDRYQRKNLAPNAGSGCLGTDLNRNFNYKWSQNGVSFNPCSDTYCGDSGGSELETQAIQAHLNGNSARQWTMVTLHSYGNDWMHPWGTTVTPGNDNAPCEIAVDHDDMFAGAEAAGQALEATGGLNWDWGNSCVVIYTTSGATDDYAKSAGWKYSYNPELRGFDFVINANQIEPSFQEVWAGMMALDAVIAGNPPL